ncbi:MAG: carbohydrate binding domain-containing protein, partial [Methanosarcinaceae archaeon]
NHIPKQLHRIYIKIVGIIISLLLLYVGCSQFENPAGIQSEQSSSLLKKDGAKKNEKKLREFAKAMAKSLEDQGVRHILKDKIGEKFDGDFDVLWKDIKNQEIDNNFFRELIDEQMDNEFSIGDIEEITLLNISIPVHYKKWDASYPILVAYTPLTIDDTEAKTINAFNSSQKEFQLDAQVEPEFPVMVIGLNERVDPVTGELLYGKNEERFSLSKPTTSGDPRVYFEWFKTNDDHEPWWLGSAEILVKLLTSLDRTWEARWTNIDEDSWYQKHCFMINYHSGLGRYLGVKFLEDDAGGSASVTLNIDEGPFKANASFSITSDDDDMGTNTLIDMINGPLNSSRGSHSTYHTAGDVNFTFYWIPHNQPVIHNSGFESTGIWTIRTGSSCSYQRSTSQKHSGSYSMFFEDQSSTNRVNVEQMAEQIVVPGEVYKAQAYYYHNSGQSQRLILQWYDLDSWISETNGWTPTSQSWNSVSVQAIAPSNAVYLKVWVGSHNSTQSSGYWDDISVELL